MKSWGTGGVVHLLVDYYMITLGDSTSSSVSTDKVSSW